MVQPFDRLAHRSSRTRVLVHQRRRLLRGPAGSVNSYATSLPALRVSVVGGLGVGAVYATWINKALKWFKEGAAWQSG